MIIVSMAVNAMAGLVLLHGGWWTLLNVVALPRPRNRLALPEVLPEIVVVVPAHNEQDYIQRTVASLKAAARDYGPARVLVVADNCDDRTAVCARDAGAEVIERDDLERRGKHFALEFAIDHLAVNPPGIVAFVDADTTVSPDFFTAIVASFTQRARAVQVHYATDEAGASSLQRLRRVAFLLSHWSRQLGASRLGLGTGIKGNGMAVAWDVAREGLGDGGVTEDAAMTLALARRGVIVRFVSQATVWGHMAGQYDAARTQDTRWEGGRFALVPRALMTALHELRRGRINTAAAAMEVASLPLSLLVFCGGAAGLMAVAGLGNSWLAAAAIVSMIAYVLTGMGAARAPWRDVLALASAPRFVLYKLSVYARILAGGHPRGWERTQRGAPHDP
jgi:cellulose synthase/poly-beta-1,6-N-acetylglucosamine synthase-like glycosyltransferase